MYPYLSSQDTIFRLTVSTEASMMSRDAIKLIDLHGQEQFLTKLQVRTLYVFVIFWLKKWNRSSVCLTSLLCLVLIICHPILITR